MEPAGTAIPADNSNADSVQPSVSYNTDTSIPYPIAQTDSCSQSVQSAITHGTSHSPGRTTATPPNLSPSSNNNGSNNTSIRVINPDTMGPMEAMPQYGQQGNLALGVRQVEWRALDQHQQQALQNSYQQNRQRSNPASDDEQTEPSSSATTRENATATTAATGYTRSDSNTGATSTFGRLIQSAAKSIDRATGANTDRKESADEEGVIEGVLIYGYLQKLNRNGKWQTRWFETDGECLTYYKSSKRTKLLASLDLAKVGSIIINHQDESGCCFIINISKRPYHLRADSRTAMKDWVITLNRVKEARMHEGNVKLLMPKDFQNNNQMQPSDIFDDHNLTPRVVVVANRQRTHAVEDDDFHSWEAMGGMDENSPFKDVAAGQNVVTAPIARWKKPTTSISYLASKFLRWARSIRKYRCSNDAENQVIIMNPNSPNGPSQVPAPSVSANRSPPKNMVVTADLLDTGVESMNPSLPGQNTGNHQVIEDDEDDDGDARFLS